MDQSDLAVRRSALAEPLADTLSRAWPRVAFVLDAEAALSMPGRTIRISWVDGPCAGAVAAVLEPRWRDEALPVNSANGRGQAYPVELVRTYSPLATAAALLLVHDAGELQGLLRSTFAAAAAVVEHQLLRRDLPDGLDADLLTRATLLAALLDGQPGRGKPRTLPAQLDVLAVADLEALSDTMNAALADTSHS